MGTEQSSTQGAPKNISRRRVVAGAAWSVPAVMVASAAPAVAASPGFLTFTGEACKLPGNSSSNFKGYVFELNANNVSGPQPEDAVTVILSVAVEGNDDPNFAVDVRTNEGTCSCGNCGGAPAEQQFCTPDGTMNQQVLIYTTEDLTGSSSNAEMVITYQVYDCNNTSSCGTPGEIKTLSSGTLSTPPVIESPGGGRCEIENVFPLPDGYVPPAAS